LTAFVTCFADRPCSKENSTDSVNELVFLQPGHDYTGSMRAQAQVSGSIARGQAFSGSAFAVFDPIITIDPSNPNAGDYTLEFSSNLFTVPLPRSSQLLAIGLALLVAITRVRKARINSYASFQPEQAL
jgi:hypothetical protein